MMQRLCRVMGNVMLLLSLVFVDAVEQCDRRSLRLGRDHKSIPSLNTVRSLLQICKGKREARSPMPPKFREAIAPLPIAPPLPG